MRRPRQKLGQLEGSGTSEKEGVGRCAAMYLAHKTASARTNHVQPLDQNFRFASSLGRSAPRHARPCPRSPSKAPTDAAPQA